MNIDFKAIVDSIDDSVVITDKDGKVIYVNPSHQTNTDIDPKDILGRKVKDIVSEGKLFTGGAVLDVLKTRKKAFKLSTVYTTGTPLVGYVTGVPIFDEKGELSLVVASSRPIYTFKNLRSDYKEFLNEIKRNDYTKKISDLKNVSKEERLQRKWVTGETPALISVKETLDKIAPTDASVLITGESGVGKEIIADEIYQRSPRNKKPFVKVNCASIPGDLLESELFGYEKGAFTGANPGGKKGLFEAANNGTILLDEIGEMPVSLQVKLLRVIQEKVITKLGSTKPIPIDVRFIASTNSDLKALISQGKFRQDLYYRLNVIPIHIPPLRERKSDIPIIIEHFKNAFSQKYKLDLELSEVQMELLKNYSWPGNIRELENVIEYLTICSPGNPPSVNEFLLRNILNMETDTSADVNINVSGNLKENVEAFERSIIINTLNKTSSLREAGEALGIDASTISRKIKQYNIDYKGKRN